MGTREYDVIVVGASFAGLAVARQLRGEVLLLDRHDVGAHQTSACGTPLWVPEALGVAGSVLQVHRRVVVHAPSRTIGFDVTDAPYCTFDYGQFCRGLLAQCRVRFLRATVTGWAGDVVETTDGRFTASCVVDCSGWRGAVAHAGAGPRPAASFGLETDTGYAGDALYFWARPERFGDGIAWLFPTGRGSRVGLGSYQGATKLKRPLGRFVDDLAATPGAYHGTYFPSGLGAATAGRTFVVGDAAGHCLPLTAEGIRPALYFGQECGSLIQQVLEGTRTLEHALVAYRRRVEAYRWAYRGLVLAQRAVMRAPEAWLGPMAALAARPGLMARWWPRYSRFGALRPLPGADQGRADETPPRADHGDGARETTRIAAPGRPDGARHPAGRARPVGSCAEAGGARSRREEARAMVKDPVCGMNVDEGKAAATSVYRGQTYHFCSQGCKATFDKAPEQYSAR
jgi:flavin-dependent dehydrogenase/YHS domain-containing protein